MAKGSREWGKFEYMPTVTDIVQNLPQMVTFVDNAKVKKNMSAPNIVNKKFIFIFQKTDFTWMFRLTFGL